jgi:hypothetical protein
MTNFAIGTLEHAKKRKQQKNLGNWSAGSAKDLGS